jgi:hypothetical protein
MDRENIPEEVSVNAIVRFLINGMNRRWEEEKQVFDQEDYRSLAEAYLTRYHHRMLSVELSEAQTLALVERCRQEGVTVNSALCAAFVGAQVVVQGEKPFHSSIGVGASLRDRLGQPVGEVMGFCAGVWRALIEKAHLLHVNPLLHTTDKEHQLVKANAIRLLVALQILKDTALDPL